MSASGSTEFPIFADFPMWVPVAGELPRVTPYINEVHAKSATPNRVELFEDAPKSKLNTSESLKTGKRQNCVAKSFKIDPPRKCQAILAPWNWPRCRAPGDLLTKLRPHVTAVKGLALSSKHLASSARKARKSDIGNKALCGLQRSLHSGSKAPV